MLAVKEELVKEEPTSPDHPEDVHAENGITEVEGTAAKEDEITAEDKSRIRYVVRLLQQWLSEQGLPNALHYTGCIKTYVTRSGKIGRVVTKRHICAAFKPQGLTHTADPPTHLGFTLGSFVPPGAVGIAYHGTSLDALLSILKDSGRMHPGAHGDPQGVYHSEEQRAAEHYMALAGPIIGGFRCAGVLLRLQVTGLVTYSDEKDPETGRFIVPGLKLARWKKKSSSPQSCSPPEKVKIDLIWLHFRPENDGAVLGRDEVLELGQDQISEDSAEELEFEETD